MSSNKEILIKIAGDVGTLNGKVEVGFKNLNGRLDKMDKRIDENEKGINKNKSEIDKAKGMSAILGVIAGFIGSVISFVIAWFKK